jgi:hypothetical protein
MFMTGKAQSPPLEQSSLKGSHQLSFWLTNKNNNKFVKGVNNLAFSLVIHINIFWQVRLRALEHSLKGSHQVSSWLTNINDIRIAQGTEAFLSHWYAFDR